MTIPRHGFSTALHKAFCQDGRQLRPGRATAGGIEEQLGKWVRRQAQEDRILPLLLAAMGLLVERAGAEMARQPRSHQDDVQPSDRGWSFAYIGIPSGRVSLYLNY